MATGIQSSLRTRVNSGKQRPNPSANRLLSAWKALSNRARTLLGIGLLAGLIALSLALRASSSGAPEELFPYSLASAELTEVSDKLTELGFAHRLNPAGNNILVRPGRNGEIRARLSFYGLPRHPRSQGHDSGWHPSSRDQIQDERYRQLADRLARSIESMDGVQTAEVYLVPQSERYFDDQPPASASVIITALAGRVLDRQQANSITRLVAGAVPGLTAEQVRLVDSSGSALKSEPDQSDNLAHQFQKELDEYLTQKAQALLDAGLGPNNSKVVVTTNFDFSQMEVKRTDVGAPGQGEALVVSQKKSETYHGPGKGPEGLEGETPSSDGRNYENVAEARRYKSDEAYTWTVFKSPRVARITCSVVLNSIVKGNQVKQWEQAVAGAIGLDPSRGDELQVAVIPMAPPRPAPGPITPQPNPLATQTPVMALLSAGGFAMVALVLVAYHLRVYYSQSGRHPLLERNQAAPLAGPADLTRTTDGRSTQLDGAETRTRTSLGALTELARSNPNAISDRLRSTWLMN